MKFTWTREAIEGLGVRTDLKTACSVLGLGLTTGKAQAKAGTFPVPIYKLAGKYVVPVRPLLEFFYCASTSPDTEEAGPASPAATLTDTAVGGPRLDGTPLRAV
jgi:hypothetical protein